MFQARRSMMYYDCYCNEHDCDSSTPQYDDTSLWWGEFDPCIYTAYVFSPLACNHLVK